MLNNKTNRHGPAPPSGSVLPLWTWCVIVAAALVVALQLYSPALNGPFLFDDIGLPFYSRSFSQQPLRAWVSGVRPILMLSYWINFQLSEWAPYGYHLGNVLLHAANSFLVFVLFSS